MSLISFKRCSSCRMAGSGYIFFPSHLSFKILCVTGSKMSFSIGGENRFHLTSWTISKMRSGSAPSIQKLTVCKYSVSIKASHLTDGCCSSYSVCMLSSLPPYQVHLMHACKGSLGIPQNLLPNRAPLILQFLKILRGGAPSSCLAALSYSFIIMWWKVFNLVKW